MLRQSAILAGQNPTNPPATVTNPLSNVAIQSVITPPSSQPISQVPPAVTGTVPPAVAPYLSESTHAASNKAYYART